MITVPSPLIPRALLDGLLKNGIRSTLPPPGVHLKAWPAPPTAQPRPTIAVPSEFTPPSEVDELPDVPPMPGMVVHVAVPLSSATLLMPATFWVPTIFVPSREMRTVPLVNDVPPISTAPP